MLRCFKYAPLQFSLICLGEKKRWEQEEGWRDGGRKEERNKEECQPKCVLVVVYRLRDSGVCWREHHTASSPWQQPTGQPVPGHLASNPIILCYVSVMKEPSESVIPVRDHLIRSNKSEKSDDQFSVNPPPV